ncbi:MAG TPA: hypothetical protein VHA75_09925 [Rugosimonospora sp.]|nr:hypothetical protein [Rugosimonospora sp.]
MNREIGLWLVSAFRLSVLPAAERAKVLPDATFAVVAVDRSTGRPVPQVLASDLDVPRDVTPVEFARRCATARGDRWVGFETDLLCRWTGDRWVAWDSRASSEERPIPADCRYPVPGEVGDFVVGAAPVPVGVAS